MLDKSLASKEHMSSKEPWGLEWRSSTGFILSTVTIGLFTDLFLYGLIIPLLPFLLRDRLGYDGADIQTYASLLLAVFAGAAFFSSPISGYICDVLSARRAIFLVGLVCLMASTVMMAIGESLWVLVIARVLGGVAGGAVWSVGIALVTDTVGSEKLGVVMGTIFSIVGVAELMSPVLGGVIYGKLGSWPTFSMGFALIALDTVMRLLLIEKRTALTFGMFGEEQCSGRQDDDLDEMASLLSKSDNLDKWKIPDNQSKLIHRLPILYCFTSSRFKAAMVTYIMQSMFFGVLDATLATEAIRLFDVDPLKAGLIFLPVLLPTLVVGPLCGHAIDRYGTKPLAVIGYTLIVPCLICLRIPQPGGLEDIIKFCVILVFTGCAIGVFASVSVVELTRTVMQYHKANPDFFGESGPYGQTYALSSMMFSAGLTIGPIFAGALRESIGFGNMYAVVAAMCGATAVVSYYYIGEKSEWPMRRWKP